MKYTQQTIRILVQCLTSILTSLLLCKISDTERKVSGKRISTVWISSFQQERYVDFSPFMWLYMYDYMYVIYMLLLCNISAINWVIITLLRNDLLKVLFEQTAVDSLRMGHLTIFLPIIRWIHILEKSHNANRDPTALRASDQKTCYNHSRV